ncbi:hypothetical protein [Luteipulveratus mongoliensis]|uniref:Peptidoglycan-binding protein n=1 Tax=Luteipulveratus mongoliensis TaxID=571913 RepID=A0A0K1JFZ2_9MICO|nr:hypothetical protein [Luteipulveratus mongoliensis]AKU15621.1 hypothetical protein VV02_06745 [Luteipulveratus mongoliensis]
MRVPVRRAAQMGAAVTAAGLAVFGLAPSASAVTKLTQAQAASLLSAAGVTHSSSGGCTNRNNASCTSYEQINQTTVDGVKTLKRASGCAINITGGTETGHASGTYSHWNGYKVDITKYACVGSYIKNTFTYIGLRGDGYPQWKAASGNLYCDEGNHWDITYFTSGG